MKTIYQSILTIGIILILLSSTYAQRTDANIVGHVVDTDGEHIPFATVILKNTTIGTATDETGHFQLINMPVGKYKVNASSIGYKEKEKEVELLEGETIELKFILQKDVMGLEQVV